MRATLKNSFDCSSLLCCVEAFSFSVDGMVDQYWLAREHRGRAGVSSVRG